MRKLQPELVRELRSGCLSGVLELVKSDKDLYFGIRDQNAIVYYMGGKIMDIKLPFNKPAPSIKIDEKYFANGEVPDFIYKNELRDWLNNKDLLKKTIKKFQLKKDGQKKEKIIQQKILLGNNTFDGSEYYIIDMEYSMPGIAYGRFDYIALQKNMRDGRYKIALVELKQGSGSLGTSKKENCKIGRNPYGSGVVGHAWNFDKFLENTGKPDSSLEESMDAISYLRRDIVSIICNYKELGLLDKDMFSEIKDEKGIEFITSSPEEIETIFLCANPIKSTRESIQKYLGLHRTKSARYNVKDNIKEEMCRRLKFAFPLVPVEGEDNPACEWFKDDELRSCRLDDY